jgi:putative ABC transport system permease protein
LFPELTSHYLTVAVRRLYRQAGYALINGSGLVIGITCSILVVLYIKDELRHADYHVNGHRIVKVLLETTLADGRSDYTDWLSGSIAQQMQDRFDEIELAARTTISDRRQSWVTSDNTMRPLQVCLADSQLLDMFDHLKTIEREPDTSLEDPGHVIITQSAARKMFGSADPLGSTLQIDNPHLGGDFRVVGLLDDITPYAHFRFDVLVTSLPPERQTTFADGWHGQEPDLDGSSNIYLILKEGLSPGDLEQLCRDFLKARLGDAAAGQALRLQPVNRSYLYSRKDYGLPQGGDIQYLFQLGAMVIAVLSIACVNYANLQTAGWRSRTKEIEVRKVAGAGRRDLVVQLIGESVLFTCIAAVVACGVTILALPRFSELVDQDLNLASEGGAIYVGLLTVAVILGVVSGGYPALSMTRRQLASNLTGKSKGLRGVNFQRVSVVLQFTLSAGLLICTHVVHSQTTYMKHRDFGAQKNPIVIAPTIFSDESLGRQSKEIKKAFLKHRNVTHVTATWPYPGSVPVRLNVKTGNHQEGLNVQVLGIDEDFMDTYDIQLVAGRNLDLSIAGDQRNAVLVNTSAVNQFGWQNPVGERVLIADVREGTVVGVVEDKPYRSSHHPIEPMVFFNYSPVSLSLRIRPDGVPKTMVFLKKTWQEFVPGQRPDFLFLSEEIEESYVAQDRQTLSLAIVSALAVFISCLGVLGLSTFTAALRTREIGIRKSFGATKSSIVILLSTEPIRLAVIGNMIATPICYTLMDSWLQEFPLRIQIVAASFLLPCALSLVAAFASSSVQTLKAAGTNPVDALKHHQ